MANKNSEVVIAEFESHAKTDTALRQLKNAGQDMRQVSVVGKGYHTGEDPIGYYTIDAQLKMAGIRDTGWQALWGSIWGLLYSGGFFLVPGVGPILAAGPVVGTLAGAVGAVEEEASDGLTQALLGAGIPPEHIKEYLHAIHANHFLLIVHGPDHSLGDVETLLQTAEPLHCERY